jgi:hypothetical protein
VDNEGYIHATDYAQGISNGTNKVETFASGVYQPLGLRMAMSVRPTLPVKRAISRPMLLPSRPEEHSPKAWPKPVSRKRPGRAREIALCFKEELSAIG